MHLSLNSRIRHVGEQHGRKPHPSLLPLVLHPVPLYQGELDQNHQSLCRHHQVQDLRIGEAQVDDMCAMGGRAAREAQTRKTVKLTFHSNMGNSVTQEKSHLTGY